ncbi:uncharacterized protein FIBRA_07985 [Fibroporia radiculosa]|uniref:Uncharacterized protein n=1 Tax=Fibroporia radiculosa TaxID=599839 RepID=J4GG42_9APHY|nr:uncharacterized protein FIBRA_07985 [Fibroporia radiculosa]CCM05753.1 predicted protein [Fibroporia radiculosa]
MSPSIDLSSIAQWVPYVYHDLETSSPTSYFPSQICAHSAVAPGREKRKICAVAAISRKFDPRNLEALYWYEVWSILIDLMADKSCLSSMSPMPELVPSPSSDVDATDTDTPNRAAQSCPHVAHSPHIGKSSRQRK